MQSSKKQKIKAKQFIIEQVILYQVNEYNANLLDFQQNEEEKQQEQFGYNLLFQYPDSIQLQKVQEIIQVTIDSLELWDKFSSESIDQNQIFYTKHSVHINKKLKDNVFLLIVLRISLDNILYKSYKTQESGKIDYFKNNYFLGKNLQLKEFAINNFMDHFIEQFRLFYSSFTELIEDNQVTESSKMCLRTFIRKYIILYSEQNNKINIMRYFYRMITYAPIDKTQFMALNYLTKIINTLDAQIKDYMIFYKGYFIYSTMNHKMSSIFYDYFYRGKHPLKQSGDKIFKRFQNALQIQDQRIDFPYGLLNQVINEIGGFLYGPKAKNKLCNYTQILQKNPDQEYFSSEDLFFPTVYLQQPDGTQIKRKMVAYLEKGINIVFLYEHDIKLSKNSFHSIQQAINKNIKTIQKNLEGDFAIVNKAKLLFTLIYYNQMNLAFKSSPENLLESLDTVTLELITELKCEMLSDPDLDDITSRTESFWIYGFRSNKRIMFLFFDGSLTLTKFTAECKEVKNLYFSQVFV